MLHCAHTTTHTQQCIYVKDIPHEPHLRCDRIHKNVCDIDDLFPILQYSYPTLFYPTIFYPTIFNIKKKQQQICSIEMHENLVQLSFAGGANTKPAFNLAYAKVCASINSTIPSF